MAALNSLTIRSILLAISLVASAATSSVAAETPPDSQSVHRFAPVGENSKPPKGWTEFCVRYAPECDVKPSTPRDLELTSATWESIVGANNWVNEHIKPITDQKHWGVSERWDYPQDGYGDCEDFALLKQRILIEAGLPREALLLTVVWTKQNQGHTVLTVRTDKGDYILDIENRKVLLWSQTGYDFVKRQSQSDPNAWVYIDGVQTPVAVARADVRQNTKSQRKPNRVRVASKRQ